MTLLSNHENNQSDLMKGRMFLITTRLKASCLIPLVIVVSLFSYPFIDDHISTVKPLEERRTVVVRRDRKTNSIAKENDPHHHHHHIYDVVIVGSGWSGLGAGERLRQMGIDNMAILEARDTIGGRSRTVYPFTTDLAVEMGSAWTMPGTEVHEMFELLGIPFGTIQYGFDNSFGLYRSRHVYKDTAMKGPTTSEIVGQERIELIDELWRNGFATFSKERVLDLETSDQDVPFRKVLNDYLQQHPIPTNSTAFQFLLAMSDSLIAVDNGAPLDEISSRSVGWSLGECIYCYYDHFIPVKGGGFDKVLKTIATPLGDKIRLQQIVTRIEYNVDDEEEEDQPVRVTYVDANDGTEHFMWAENVLLTVPLGVLKANSIEFVPSLPKWKQDAIDDIGFGVLDKCILYWDNHDKQVTTWWPHGKEYMVLIPEEDGTSGVWTTFFNDQEIGNGEDFVLSSWIAGDKALAMESQPDQAIVQQVLKNLRSMLGEDVPEPTSYVISRWGKDPYARGSYSYNMASGGGKRHLVDMARQNLAQTVGTRLFWAGEATYTDYGSTFGAYNSGRRAAQRIETSLVERQKSTS